MPATSRPLVNKNPRVPSILDYFPPALQPRPQQVEALNFVEEAFNNGYRDVVIEAPTGAGKSILSATLCRWGRDQGTPEILPGGYVLVVQKALQDQMARDLDKLGGGKLTAALLKGANEYPCPRFKACGNAVKGCSCRKQGTCPYVETKKIFLSSAIGVTNYAYYLTDAIYLQHLKTRAIMCCDEAHNLSKTLRSIVGMTINQSDLEKRDPDLAQELPGLGTQLSDLLAWLQTRYLPVIYERVLALTALAEEDGATVSISKMAFETRTEYLRVRSVAEDLEKDALGWVYWKEEARSGGTVLRCSPLNAGPFFEKYMGAFPRRVYLSAYVGRHEVFCQELGLDPKKVAIHRCASTFPPENRPVILLNAGSLGKSSQFETLGPCLRITAKIANHNKERGIIHAHSYDLAEKIAASLRDAGLGGRLVYPLKAEDRDAALEEHANNPGSILLSPSIYEGYDFAGDLARWQVVVKCPYASLNDKVVSTLAARDETWYELEALKCFLQAAGRIVRGETDSGVTYVLDSDLGKLVRRYHSDLPLWFSGAIHER